MPTLKIEPNFLSEEDSRKIASRQILSFLTIDNLEHVGIHLGDEKLFAPDEFKLLDEALHEPPAKAASKLFRWTSREIYDVDSRMLFRDQLVNLGEGNELCVRTAASDLLRTPVWSIKAGPALDIEGMVAKTLKELPHKGLRPIFVGDEKDVRIVCYSYPRLGIMCSSLAEPPVTCVIDISDLNVLPLDAAKQQEQSDDVNTVWSPYDIVVSSTIGQFRSLWAANVERLRHIPEGVGNMLEMLLTSNASVLEERKADPPLRLVAQPNDKFCAVATAQMILEQHGFIKNLNEIAAAMNASEIKGATPIDQVRAIGPLSEGALIGELDLNASLDEAKREIRLHRPLKVGVSGHARACGGFKTEVGGRNFLYIYDPYPVNVGQTYYEDWTAVYHTNYMYVKPPDAPV